MGNLKDANQFVGKTVFAKKDLNVKVSMSDKFAKWKKGERVGEIDSKVFDKFTNPNKPEWKFAFITEYGKVFIPVTDLDLEPAREEIKKEEKEAEEKKKKAEETYFDKLGFNGIVTKILIAVVVVYVVVKVIESKT